MLPRLPLLYSFLIGVIFVAGGLEFEDDTHSGLVDYCQWETFNASCPAGSVVLMRRARYGRMQLGRCIQENHGSLGCYADVLTALDARCSGKQSCQLALPDATLHRDSDCPRELMRYLQASYDCLQTQSADPRQCREKRQHNCTDNAGYVSSDTARTSSTGTRACPWSIRARHGQRLNLTLYAFGDSVTNCDTDIVIREANRTIRLPVCGSRRRARHLWSSRTSRLRMHIEWGMRTAMQTFLIQYKGIGCGDLKPIPHAVVERTGGISSVRCKFGIGHFFLVCTDGEWVGDISNCTAGNALRNQSPTVGVINFPFGLLFVIALGAALGVAFGILMLAAIFAYRRKRREEAANRQLHTTDPLLSGSTTPHDSVDNQRSVHNMWIECPYSLTARTSPTPCVLHDSIYVRTVDVPCAAASACSVPRASPANIRRNSYTMASRQDSDASFSTFRPDTDALRPASAAKSSVDLLREAVSESRHRELNTVL